ncbi:M23 family metallopeptidase [Microbacterium sp. LRZ72]|uniref:M23 family metallopeptidase n=1 Tax=Microbacterium sp. LRZ72 TaxID=2942481 RepID=UPI0029A2E7EA|nr:M23 family metallopeptidase [Microbacterium sp. LRZ72]MDX2377871.1 M23 family metallopeptidase [Microbacterium sp. LRZ72]
MSDRAGSSSDAALPAAFDAALDAPETILDRLAISRRSMVGGGILAALGLTALGGSVYPTPAAAAADWYYPFSTRGRINNPFDPYNTWYADGHKGIDCHEASGADESIRAIRSGTVAYAGSLGQLGNTAIVNHAQHWSLYAHMTPGSPYVSVGETVLAGSVLGMKGTTGLSTGPHLHLEIGRGAWRGMSGRTYSYLLDPETLVGDAPPAPTTPIPTAPNLSIPGDEYLRVIKNTSSGQHYVVGPQYICHITSDTQAAVMGSLYNVGVDWNKQANNVINLSDNQFNIVLDALAIPRSRKNSVLSGGDWSLVSDSHAHTVAAARRNFYKRDGSTLWLYVLPSGDYIRTIYHWKATLYKEIGGGLTSLTISADAFDRLVSDLQAGGGRNLA